MNQCVICVEKINLTKNSPIKCEYCDFIACRKCCMTFILNEIEPKCMNTMTCNRIWTRQFIVKTFSNVFINKQLKKHREQIIFDRERSLLPSTQPIVERQIKIEQFDNDMQKKMIEINKLKKDIFEKQREKIKYLDENSIRIKQRATFIRPCSVSNCRGFLSSQWKCGLCEKWTCSHCLITKETGYEDEHVCDDDNVASATLILKETKSCPTCGIGIYKIEGCCQMFCTQCNTAFDWTTGRIFTNNIHNPHYFEWIRRTGGNENTIENQQNNCNHPIFNQNIYIVIRNKIKERNCLIGSEIDVDLQQKIHNIIRRMIHLNQVEIPHCNEFILNPNDYNTDLRIRYLRNIIDEEEFKKLLQRKDKKRQKYQEILNILQMIYNASVDIIMRIARDLSNKTWKMDVFDPLNEIDELIQYANECFHDISNTYQSKELVFSITRNLYLS